ncbi:MAG: putative toxin-antitoxin system toxin component, PIN family, partial [Anaerolineales bacterium]|nr:putative toxin-antitoxin system toxin component, PIN family [Anaerolineales bacterium]
NTRGAEDLMLLIVLDTNVLVSGMLNVKGSPGKVLDLILGNQIQVVYDNRILGEYEEVLTRPELRLDQNKVIGVVDHIELSGIIIEPNDLPKDGYTDLDDIMFAEVFITSNADALVTSNLRHYKPLLEQNAVVLSPAQFLERYFPEK